MEKEDIVFDPTDLQLNSYGKVGLEDIDVAEMTNEQSVKMLLYQHVLNLHELKSAKRDLADCKKQIEILKETREELRIRLASTGNSIGIDIASIFISFLGGFAINMLTSNWSSGIGWVIFLLCLTIILSFKLPYVSAVFKNITESNGEKML